MLGEPGPPRRPRSVPHLHRRFVPAAPSGLVETPHQVDVLAEAQGFVEADGRAAGHIKRSLESFAQNAKPDAFVRELEAGARDLVAAGLELHIDEARVSLPQGLIELELHIAVEETGSDGFTWPEALLATEATADFGIGEGLVQLAMAANPEVGGIIGMGYLRKNGDVYEMRAAFRKGLLTVNGAPVPVPLNGLQ